MGGEERGDDAAVLERTIRMGGMLLVMELDGKIIATSWLTQDGRRVYLHHFGILPQWQGRGWSGPLLKASLSWVRAQGMQVKLEVHSENRKAVNLYVRAGFKPLGKYDVYIIRQPENIMNNNDE